ncbi:MAG: hypothetical protein JO332_14375 [Planctomycetaceae bacterium]|nr:hypothetical protein [Planctomycetaceae bacterium]
MSSNRAWVWTGRLAALVAAVVIPACGSTGSPGGSNPNGIIWNSQGTTGGGGAPSPGGSLWVDPNSGLGASQIGINNIIVSTDDATYDGYYPSGTTGLAQKKITYIIGLLHPLSTDSGSTALTGRENTLQGQINGYRQTKLGNAGGGGGGLGGGVVVGGTTGIILAGHFKATKSARAHCKHAARFENPGTFDGGVNPEGDACSNTTGAQANPTGLAGENPDGVFGRLGKLNVTSAESGTNILNSIGIAGPGFGEADPIFKRLVQLYQIELLAAWTNFAVGHWRGGGQLVFYWNVIFLTDPDPTN